MVGLDILNYLPRLYKTISDMALFIFLQARRLKLKDMPGMITRLFKINLECLIKVIKKGEVYVQMEGGKH